MTSATLLAQLRRHCGGCRCGRICSDCDPATGRYCAWARPLIWEFWRLRRAEVFGG